MTEEWYANVPQILLDRTPHVLKSAFPSPRLVALPKQENPIYSTLLLIAEYWLSSHSYLMTVTYVSDLFKFTFSWLLSMWVKQCSPQKRAALLWTNDTKTRITCNCTVSGHLTLVIHVWISKGGFSVASSPYLHHYFLLAMQFCNLQVVCKELKLKTDCTYISLNKPTLMKFVLSVQFVCSTKCTFSSPF